MPRPATLNAVPIRFDEVARAQIAAAGGRPAGPFGGVPFLLKDIGQEFAGQPATRGSRVFREVRPMNHSAFTARCLKAGLVIYGRTATPELGLKAVTESKLYGPTRNPWDLSRTAGGSSGGSAAAVSGGLVPMAGANDGGGSIRIPASFCGLFGLKPSTGRVSWGPGAGQVWEGASVNGVLTRSVRDTARMLDILCGPEPGDLFVLAPPERPYADELLLPPGRLRIGFSTASPAGTPVDPACVQAVEDAARLLERLGHDVEQAAPAVDGGALAACYITLYLGQVAAEVAGSGAHLSAFEPETAILAELGRALPAGAYVEKHLQWNGFARALGAFHQTYDFWLLPTVAAPPARIGALDTPPRPATPDRGVQAVARWKIDAAPRFAGPHVARFLGRDAVHAIGQSGARACDVGAAGACRGGGWGADAPGWCAVCGRAWVGGGDAAAGCSAGGGGVLGWIDTAWVRRGAKAYREQRASREACAGSRGLRFALQRGDCYRPQACA